jgi:conjugative relaxase-like TrwC/TraI family protein
MHEIVDAERDATLEYLDRLASERGGRRGRAQTRVATGGLIWATSRHATTRAGDPQVHDHVLIANAVFMRDARGGWKGADTAFLRDHLHAATAVGRMTAAAKAVELGYGIVADPGPSGRLGGWAIAGIPAEVCELHSTRSAQITAAVGSDASYAARSVAARATRDRKAEVPVEDLLTRWQEELSAAGHPPADLLAAIEAAGFDLSAPRARPRGARQRAARPRRAPRQREDLHPKRRDHRGGPASSRPARLCARPGRRGSPGE